MVNINIAAIIQARRGSTRLPDKIFLDIQGRPLIYHVVNRLKQSKLINETIIATTTNKEDDKLELWAKDNNVKIYRGSELNVLQRYYKAAIENDVDIIVRITADDPFKDYRLIDEAIEVLIDGNLDFVCNNNPISFPEGLDVEVLSFNSLKKSYRNAVSDFDKEHVTQYIHKNQNKFKVTNLLNSSDLSFYRWTIDTEEDYKFVSAIYKKLYSVNKLFLPEDIYKLLEENPSLMTINKHVKKSQLYN